MRVDYAMLGRKLMKENPQAAVLYQNEINECKSASLQDTELINHLFILFCRHLDLEVDKVRSNYGRNTADNVSTRRMFIAVIVQMYDLLNINGYTGRKTDKVREKISDVLNCHEVWISQVWPSVYNDIVHLKGYKEETHEIIHILRELLQSQPVSDIKFTNSRRNNQISLF